MHLHVFQKLLQYDGHGGLVAGQAVHAHAKVAWLGTWLALQHQKAGVRPPGWASSLPVPLPPRRLLGASGWGGELAGCWAGRGRGSPVEQPQLPQGSQSCSDCSPSAWDSVSPVHRAGGFPPPGGRRGRAGGLRCTLMKPSPASGASRGSDRTGVCSALDQSLLSASCSYLTPNLGLAPTMSSPPIAWDGLPQTVWKVLPPGGAHLAPTRVGTVGLNLVHTLLVAGHLAH